MAKDVEVHYVTNKVNAKVVNSPVLKAEMLRAAKSTYAPTLRAITKEEPYLRVNYMRSRYGKIPIALVSSGSVGPPKGHFEQLGAATFPGLRRKWKAGMVGRSRSSSPRAWSNSRGWS